MSLVFCGGFMYCRVKFWSMVLVLGLVFFAKFLHAADQPVDNSKFILVKTFRIVTPIDYDHGAQLGQFFRKFSLGGGSRWYDENITDKHFFKASYRLASSYVYTIKLWKVAKRKTVDAKECLAFLRSNRIVLVGAQGLTVIFDRARNQLPCGFIASFDEPSNLWKSDCQGENYGAGEYLIPFIYHCRTDTWIFRLESLCCGLINGDYLIGFCKDLL